MHSDRAGVAIALGVVLIGGLVGYLAWRRPPAAPASSPAEEWLPREAPSPQAGRRSSQPAGRSLRIQIVGAVRRPGHYTLPTASRVEQAVKAAGGFAPGADAQQVNLARYITDGELIRIPLARQVERPLRHAAAPTAASGVVRLNYATREELEALPGVGPKTAQRILDYRARYGPFRRLEDLLLVPRIGPKTLDRLRPLISLR